MSKEIPAYGLTDGGAPLQRIPAEAAALVVACVRCGHPVGQPCAEKIEPLPGLRWLVLSNAGIEAIFSDEDDANTYAGNFQEGTVNRITVAKGTP